MYVCILIHGLTFNPDTVWVTEYT